MTPSERYLALAVRNEELVEALYVFAYGIAGIGELDDDALREAAVDITESPTVQQLAPAILHARSLIAKNQPETK